MNVTTRILELEGNDGNLSTKNSERVDTYKHFKAKDTIPSRSSLLG
jgi:hypothetical protein